MTEIPDRPFDKIAIDLVTESEASKSGNKYILTIIDHLTGWQEAFPIPDKLANNICQSTCAPCTSYLTMAQNSRTTLWIKY